MEEIWLPVTEEPFCKNYSVSNYGRVRSEDRIVAHIADGKRLKSRILKPRYTWKHGYPIVNLSANNKKKTFRVHTLVALAFHGPRPSGAEVRHLDGNAKNSHLSNLAYGSRRDNVDDMISHGTVARGEKLARSRIKESDIRIIREDTRMHKEIAAEFGVGISAIYNIKARRTWKHVK